MLHALTAPVYRSVLVAGLVLALGAVAHGRHDPSKHRLALHTEWRSDAIYLSAWTQGEELTMSLADTATPLTLGNRGWMWDGCHWLGVETLTPVDDHTYAYRYDETVLECKPGHHPTFKTPRTGYVAVDE